MKFSGQIKIIAVILLLLILWFIFTLTDNYIPKTGEIPNINDLNDIKALCKINSTGWECSFNKSEYDPQNYSKDPLILNYANACQQQEGKWTCSGFCLPYYPHYCNFKYADAGAICISDIQCGSNSCNGLFGVGTCSAYPWNHCQNNPRLLFIIPDPSSLFTVYCD